MVFSSSNHFPNSSYISSPFSPRFFSLLNSQSKPPIKMSKILPFQIVNPTPRIYPRTVTWILSKPVLIPSVSKCYTPIYLAGLRPYLHTPSFSFSSRALDDSSSSMETQNENIGELSEMEEHEKISGQGRSSPEDATAVIPLRTNSGLSHLISPIIFSFSGPFFHQLCVRTRVFEVVIVKPAIPLFSDFV